MITQTSTAAVTGTNIPAGDHNSLVTDVAALIAAANSHRLDSPIIAVAGAPLVLDLRAKASAFTFGTAPVTSAGYFRHPDGSPWAGDAIQGDPMDLAVTNFSYSSATAPNTLIGQALYLLPAHGALTVSKVEALIPCAGTAGGGGSPTLDKVELVVVKIDAAGVETQLGSVGANSTAAAISTSGYNLITRFVSADLGASYAVAATERLGVRIKWYGHEPGGGSHTIFPLADFVITGVIVPWATKPVRFAFYVA